MLFALDRQTFSHIVKEASIRRRDRFERFLSKVELLAELDAYEKSKLCDVLQTESFEVGQAVIRQGERGDKFYLIEEGEAVVKKKNESSFWLTAEGIEELVYEYKPNDYFGELALLSDAPRAASVYAKTTLKVNSIDRDSFKRLLGPLEDLLKRNVSKYQKFLSNRS